MPFKKIKQYHLPGYNYASNDAYFVTIMCANRDCFLGSIENGKIEYSEIGEIVLNELNMAIDHKKNIVIPNYVIMPNHIHLIVELRNEEVTEKASPSILPLGDGFERKGHISPLQKGSLGAFVNHFKGRITRRLKELGFVDFGWQPRYNDRIIRNVEEYNAISEYIDENISNWDEDSEQL
jgi:putative transposase